jgi:hypothetical protein
VVLLGDKEYDQGHVVKVLCKVIAGLGACYVYTAYCVYCVLAWCSVVWCGGGGGVQCGVSGPLYAMSGVCL